jgi:GntR family transcriptional regulator, transcriptional repressor for pyruvate dehydrogenase complex
MRKTMKKIILKPLKISRLSEIIETHIRDLILDGEIKVGERLPTEKGLCEQFGVSSVTAREALKGLEVLGLIEKKKGKNGGIFVSQMKSESVKIPIYSFLNSKKATSMHLTEIRMVLEPMVVRIAASRMTPAEIKYLEKNVLDCKQRLKKAGQAFSEKDFFDIEEKNVEFHRLIAEATHNPVLAFTIDYVCDFLFFYKKKTLIPDIELSKRTIDDHVTILTQLKTGNADDAEKEMSMHLKRLEEYFEKQKTQGN